MEFAIVRVFWVSNRFYLGYGGLLRRFRHPELPRFPFSKRFLALLSKVVVYNMSLFFII